MSLLVVEIDPADEPEHKVGANDGKSWDHWEQKAYLTSGGRHPIHIKIRRHGSPFPPGFYLLGAGSLQERLGVSTFGQKALATKAFNLVSYPDLIPIADVPGELAAFGVQAAAAAVPAGNGAGVRRVPAGE